ncbi:MAG: hypothetical protein V8T36_10475 [Ruthenibacterium lactatiformans]
MQHEIEEAALKKETDRLSDERLSKKELADMRDEFSAMSAAGRTKKRPSARCRSCARR